MLSGFPFDGSRRSRDPLEDIAQRHPELAQHLQGFPRRGQRSGDQDDEEFFRRLDRPFTGGRFERFGFPFDRDDFEREPQRYYEAYPEYFENYQNQQPQSPSHQQQGSTQTQESFQPHSPQFSQQYQPSPSQYNQEYQQPQDNQQAQYNTQISQGTQTDCEAVPETDGAAEEPKEEEGQIRSRPIQQSNTCDLGQSSPDEAVNDRNQRSMSLPPENKRYTSSINIPMGGHQGQENGAKSQCNSQSGSSGSTERVIPIHVEGRDDPVLPRHFNTTSTQSHPPAQPERIFTDTSANRSQPERIFGQRPEHFTQFVNRDPHRGFPSDWHHSFDSRFPEEEFGFGRAGSPSRWGGAKQPQQQPPSAQQFQQQCKQEAAPSQGYEPPQATQKPQPHEQQAAQNEAPPAPKPPKQPQGPIEQIQAIQKDVSNLIRQVEVFNGMPKDKNYLYLDEMLTRNLLKLDNVDTQGQDSIRQARKEAIKCIEKTISHLESKAAANAAAKGQKMDVDQTQPSLNEKAEGEPSQGGMDVTSASQPDAASASQPTESDKMEVSSSQESNKSGEGTQQSKSVEAMESSQEQTKTEEKQPEVKKEEKDVQMKHADQNSEDKPNTKVAESQAANESSETNIEGAEVKGEKKEKRKIKKKVNKEDKETKQ